MIFVSVLATVSLCLAILFFVAGHPFWGSINIVAAGMGYIATYNEWENDRTQKDE